MRKPDEIALYAAMREDRASGKDKTPVDEICVRMSIPIKRGFSLLEKWETKRWIDSGVNIRWCWFEPDAPAALLPWGVVQ